MTDDSPATVLVVEDDPGIAVLERERLEEAGYRVDMAASVSEADARLRAAPVDLMLLDYRLPGGSDGLEFYDRLRADRLDPPVILVTGFSDEATVIRALRAGVRDFVTKSLEYLDYLPEAVGRVLRQVRTEGRLAESEARFRSLIESMDDTVFTLDRAQRHTGVFGRGLGKFGLTPDDILGKTARDLLGPAAARPHEEAAGRALAGERVLYDWNHHDRGGVRWFQSALSPLVTGGAIAGVVGVGREVTDHRLAEEAYRRSEMLFRRVWEKSHDGMRLTDDVGTIRRVNDAYCRLVGLPRERLEGEPLTAAYAADQGSGLLADHARRFATRSDAQYFTKDRVLWDGRKVQLDASYTFLDPPGQPPLLLSVVRDITAQGRLEQQYRQAQKMEVVGRLAGGVAHDFNNLLTVINGFADLALDDLPAPHPARGMIEEVRRSGNRAADLTRQLLALSRQQVLNPKVLDLNAVVRDAARMLQRLIGEDVQLESVLDPGLRGVRADPGQVEQVVMNLVVNARDAMPTGGRLTVATLNADTAAAARAGADPLPGGYVVLRVADTGTGMTPEVRERIFDPFFTTKEAGQGTGLGLATVYGIVTQAGGHIAVESEVGRGTSFEVFLPATSDSTDGSKVYTVLRDTRRGTETVLLAEDDEAVRAFARRVLNGAGYKVLEAGDGTAVVGLAELHPGPIDLLVSDVVMPGLGGRELAARVAALRPGVKVLFLSGYNPDAVIRHGVQEAAVAFLQKPFTPAAFTAKVREVLDMQADLTHPPTTGT